MSVHEDFQFRIPPLLDQSLRLNGKAAAVYSNMKTKKAEYAALSSLEVLPDGDLEWGDHKFNVRTIAIDRTFGPDREIGAPRVSNTGVAESFELADEMIQLMVKTAGDENTTMRFDFYVTWEGNDHFEGQIEVWAGDSGAGGLIQAKVRKVLRYLAGQFRPDVMTAEEYEQFLERIPAKKAWVLGMLETVDLS